MAVDQQRLHRALNPRTVVVVGDKFPYIWLESQREYKGALYSVQVDPKEAAEIERRGFTNVASIADVPVDEIDLVICAVPRKVAPIILEQAIAADVAGIHFFTAGFAEVGDPEGIELQDRLATRATESGIVLIGPNCMGVYNRRLGVKFTADVRQGDGGDVSFIGQSGTHSINLTLLAELAGLGVTRAISIGNAITTNESDYLEYLRDDPDTSVIGMYVEGMRDGRRFFEVLRDTTPRKPVVLWKGGRTSAGSRATLSHTASLATSSEVWDALVRQTGAIPASSIDEAVDVVSALSRAGAPKGRRVALLAMTGGQSVAITDAFAGAGLEVPRLSAESYERLKDVVNVIGGSYQNPFDIANTIAFGAGGSQLVKILEILADDPNIDGAVFEFSAGFFVQQWQMQPGMLEGMLDALDGFRARTRLPLVTVLHPYHQEEAVRPVRDLLLDRGYAVYPNFERAAVAYSRLVDYHLWRSSLS